MTSSTSPRRAPPSPRWPSPTRPSTSSSSTPSRSRSHARPRAPGCRQGSPRPRRPPTRGWPRGAGGRRRRACSCPTSSTCPPRWTRSSRGASSARALAMPRRYTQGLLAHPRLVLSHRCDAMLHARSSGETFGLAVAEFSASNRPVATESYLTKELLYSKVTLLKS